MSIKTDLVLEAQPRVVSRIKMIQKMRRSSQDSS